MPAGTFVERNPDSGIGSVMALLGSQPSLAEGGFPRTLRSSPPQLAAVTICV